jgi:cell division protein FtsL
VRDIGQQSSLMAILIRFNALLLVFIMSSAFYLVQTQYQFRQFYAEIDRARLQTRRLQAEHEQLKVQKQAQGTSARVQQIATNHLKMHPPNPGTTIYLEHPVFVNTSEYPAQ